MSRWITPIWIGLAAMGLCLVVAGARGQGVDVAGRPVSEVKVLGCKTIDPQLVRNQIRIEPGRSYDPQTVTRDIQNITRLGRFKPPVRVDVKQNADGSVTVYYIVEEQPVLADVQVVGNKALTDQDLLVLVVLRGGDVRDEFLIKRGQRQIIEAYKDAGYFLSNVEVDDQTLDESNVLVYRVREGPRVKVRDVVFEGNAVFTSDQLDSKIGTKEYFFLLEKGELSDEKLDKDIASLRDFYAQRGYIDARIGRRIQLSDDQKSARIVFTVEEGEPYCVGNITMSGPTIFSEAQIREAMPLKTGSVYSGKTVNDSVEAVTNLYGRIGYLSVAEGGSTQVAIRRVPRPDEPVIDLIVAVREGQRYIVGDVIVRNNQQTQDKVIRRQLRGLEPGRPYDRPAMKLSEERVRQSALFNEAKITIQGNPDEQVRDALVEVKEGRTGSLSFGAAINSDAGIFGAIDLSQRNFNIADFPESWDEFISGQAFRGAGQSFRISLQPGQEVSNYSVSFSEPYLNDSDYFLSTSLFWRTRDYDTFEGNYNEERVGGTVGLGKRFGDVWSASITTQYQSIEIFDLAADAPVDAVAVQGDSALDSLGFSVVRNTTDSRIFPTQGSLTRAGIERFGVFGTDYTFTSVTARYNKFWTVHEDFFGRRTVLSLRAEVGYILEDNEAPLFERYYAGGHRSFRGFRFRGIGPRGIRSDTMTVGDDAVGGEWLFLLGTEYNFPIYEEYIRGVFFVDSGTVQEDLGLDQYRVSAGAGVRLLLPFLGQAPFAFDLAIPLMKEEGDETRVFSFSLALPF